jgi:hypothetical protein
VTSPQQPGTAANADPDVAATVRLLHRRHAWAVMTVTGFFAFALGEGAYASAQQQGTPPPTWFLAVVIALGVLFAVGIAGWAVDSALLRRKHPEVKGQAARVAAGHRSAHLHHYPPRHRPIWVLRWVGSLLIFGVAVVSVPAVVDGVAFLTGADGTVTFKPVSHQTDCGQYGCQTSTDGILETGGAGTNATWPDVVPLNKPFQVSEPAWRWGLGQALINGDGIAIGAVLIGLLIEGFAALLLVRLVMLTRNWLRFRQHRRSQAPVAVS